MLLVLSCYKTSSRLRPYQLVKALGVSCLLTILAISLAQADEWSEAEKKIVRLGPSSFSELPKHLVEKLSARNCKIPQTYLNAKPQNVIRGSFAEKGQTDWAVLCSRNGVSSIQIFWGGPAKCLSKIEEREDRVEIQSIGETEIGYSRLIEPISRQAILESHKAHGVPPPPHISHQGIEEMFLEKASTIHYCKKGKWIELTGSE